MTPDQIALIFVVCYVVSVARWALARFIAAHMELESQVDEGNKE